jgi:hypothetical protein
MGQVFTAGENYYGQLGDGFRIDRFSPVSIARYGSYVAISAKGNGNTVAIDSNGMIWTWGRNDYGELGDNTTTYRSSPVSIVRSGSYVSVSAGAVHTVAIDDVGMVWAWGANGYGGLGDNTNVNKSSPVSIARFGSYIAVSAGAVHTVAIDDVGMVWAWGANGYGTNTVVANSRFSIFGNFEIATDLRNVIDPVTFRAVGGDNTVFFTYNEGDYTSGVFTGGRLYTCTGHLTDAPVDTNAFITEYIPLSQTDVRRQYVPLSYMPDPFDCSNFSLNIAGGAPQNYGTDFYVEDAYIKWGGMTLESELEAGDIFRIIYK